MRADIKYLKFIWIIPVVLIVLIGIALKQGMVPTKIIFPGGGTVELKERVKENVTTLRVTVIGNDRLPVEDAKVWLSIGGEAKIVAGGWEFDIPISKIPADHRFQVYAEQQNSHLKGYREITANDSGALTVTILLVRDISAYVKGTVSDESSRPIVGASVNIVGSSGSTTTDSQGFFSLSANAAEGEEVRLQILKNGYETMNQYHPAGNVAAYIILKRKQ